jgi:1-acyl-sn-glycerol-3-phosphate acyltransferase
VIRILISGVLWVLASCYFLGFLLLALGLSYLLPFRTFDPILKALMRGLFRVLFIRVEVEGAERIDPDGTSIFVANHSSMLDIPLVAGFVPGFLRGIEASDQHGWPLYGWVMGRLGNLPIRRDDVHSSISTMKRAEAYLETGGSLIIFPEGHRTPTGELLAFKKLPFHLAKRSGRAIVPVTIKGMFEINNKNSFMIRPGRVSLSFGAATDAAEYQDLSVVELRDRVEGRMRNTLEDAGPA